VSVALVCPRCKTVLLSHDGSLTCASCGAAYPIHEGVPILLSGALSDQHEHQRRYFDTEFQNYERYEPENWRLSFIERIFGALGLAEDREPYLDVGVGGSGATVIEAARLGVASVGCDLSVEGVTAARRFARQEGVDGPAAFVVCAAEALPFPEHAFSAASAVALLEHLDDDRQTVAELARVVRPGGLVWLTVPHAYRYMPPPVWPIYWWHDRRIGHKRHYDERRLVELCAEAGLEHVRTSYSAHPVKLLQFAGTKLFRTMREQRSSMWWRLEGLDRRAEDRRIGALQLSAVFRRESQPVYRGRFDGDV
jgi:ubiquinone/menaquinone biosynthesis C-methylase UbiE